MILVLFYSYLYFNVRTNTLDFFIFTKKTIICFKTSTNILKLDQFGIPFKVTTTTSEIANRSIKKNPHFGGKFNSIFHRNIIKLHLFYKFS